MLMSSCQISYRAVGDDNHENKHCRERAKLISGTTDTLPHILFTLQILMTHPPYKGMKFEGLQGKW